MCQDSKDVKCQIVKHLDYGGGSQKEQIDIMRFTHIDINFDVRYEGHQKCPKRLLRALVTMICNIKIDINMCEPHCVNLFFL